MSALWPVGLDGRLQLYEILVIVIQAFEMRGQLPAIGELRVEVQDRGPPRQRLPPSPDFHELIGLLRLLHNGGNISRRRWR